MNIEDEYLPHWDTTLLNALQALADRVKYLERNALLQSMTFVEHLDEGHEE